MKKFGEYIKGTINRNDLIFISVISAVFSLLRFPSVVEPYWYGDEGVYEVVGMALRQGRILYSGIWDNKPPILYLIYAIFNGDQFSAKLLSLIFGLLSTILFFLVAKRFFKNNKSVIFSTSFFAIVFGLPIIEGNIANAENFMILPTLVSFYLLFCMRDNNRFKLTWIAGLVLSLAFLTKIVALFDFAAFSTALLALRFFDRISFKRSEVVREMKALLLGLEQEAVFGVAFIVPVILTFIYFISVGALSDFWRAAFSQNVGYVAYGNFFIFPNGLLYLKMFLLLFSVLLIFTYRRFVGKIGIIILIWLAFSMFDAFFSARPYTHYLLVLLPAFSLTLGLIFESKMTKIAVPILLVCLIIIFSQFKLYTKIVPYYINYLTFVTGGDVTKYQNFFDRRVSRDYDLANYIKYKTKPTDGIFIWGDNPQIYALSGKLPPGRYTVSYHITFYQNAISETKGAIDKSKPRYIIQIKDDNVLSNFLDNYDLRYKVDDATIYERQY